MSDLYKGKSGSPITYLASDISAAQTTISVGDDSALPEAPNICTIGFGENIETIKYGVKSNGVLQEVVRGVEGNPRAWPSGTEVARFFTAYDHNAIIDSFNEHLAESATDGVHNLATTKPITYYVSPTGNDNNNGLSPGTAFKTIAKAISVIPNIVNHTITIQLADGDYTGEGEVLLNGFIGRSSMVIQGNTSDNSRCRVSRVLPYGCTASIVLQHLNIRTTTASLVTARACSEVTIQNCSCIATAANQDGIVAISSKVAIKNCAIWNRRYAIYSQTMSQVYSDTNEGSNNNIGLMCADASIIGKNGSQPGGTTAEATFRGGVIR